MKLENLKCCGNCKLFDREDCCWYGDVIKDTYSDRYCDNWVFDELTQNNRK